MIQFPKINGESTLANLLQLDPAAKTGLLYMSGLYQPWTYAKSVGATHIHPFYPSNTLREIASHGGRILRDNSKEPGIQPWDRYHLIADPSGNPWSLWKCSPSRSWTEPERMTDFED